MRREMRTGIPFLQRIFVEIKIPTTSPDTTSIPRQNQLDLKTFLIICTTPFFKTPTPIGLVPLIRTRASKP
jgi:hypothetical protein